MPKHEPVTLTVKITLTEQDMRDILSCSIERVLNNARNLGEKTMHTKNVAISEMATCAFEDCEGIKNVNTKIWDRTRDAIFRYKNGLEEQS